MPSFVDPTMSAGLLAPSLRTFIALSIKLPTHTVRLIDGSGVVTFGAGTFTGFDPVGGTIRSLPNLSDSMATEAPRFQISLFPPSDAAIAQLAAPNAQSSEVLIWYGLIDDATGLVKGQPTLRGRGQTDVPRVLGSKAERYVELDCGSVWDRLFVRSEGARWIDSEHQNIWPGEDGLAHTAKAGDFPIWGTEPAKKK